MEQPTKARRICGGAVAFTVFLVVLLLAMGIVSETWGPRAADSFAAIFTTSGFGAAYIGYRWPNSLLVPLERLPVRLRSMWRVSSATGPKMEEPAARVSIGVWRAVVLALLLFIAYCVGFRDGPIRLYFRMPSFAALEEPAPAKSGQAGYSFDALAPPEALELIEQNRIDRENQLNQRERERQAIPKR
ncbi:MAG: hypothetical protein V4451_17040 [Pseudomonadota bacterium]